MIETQGKIFIIVLFTLAIGQAKEELEVMKEMIVGLNERLAKTELELAATKDDLITTKAKTEELEKEMTIQRETTSSTPVGLTVAISPGDRPLHQPALLLHQHRGWRAGNHHRGVHSSCSRVIYCLLERRC